MLSLVVDAKDGDHICDTTIVELAITEAGTGGRTWDLTREVVDSIHAGNPHPDAAGNPDVWHFYSQPAAAPAPQPSQPPFDQASQAKTAREFLAELGAKRLTTIRQRTRAHAEQTWEGAVTAMRGTNLPPHPHTAVCAGHAGRGPQRTAHRPVEPWRLAPPAALGQGCRGQMALQRLPVRHPRLGDLHDPARAGPARHAPGGRRRTGPMAEPAAGTRPGQGTHPWSKPDRPLGHFSDGPGCLTHAVGPEGAGGHMDAVHCMGPGAIMFTLAEHFRLTGDLDWLKANAPRMKANAEWILRQRRLLAATFPAGSASGARACSRPTWSRPTAIACTCSSTNRRPTTGWPSNPWPRCWRDSTRRKAPAWRPRPRPTART